MSEKRFKVCIDSNNGVGLFDNSIRLLFIKFTNKEDAVSCKDSLKYQCNLMNELYDENEQLRQIMNDIVVATDETYAKNASVFKVTVVLDFEKYMEIRRCIE